MDYTKLNAWQHSRKLVNVLYDLTARFPKEEVFGLSNQLRRAGVSVASNIAEGCGRRTVKDKLYFLHVSRGSLFEIETQCFIASDRNYFTHEEFEMIMNIIQNCKRLLNGYINHLKEKKPI